MIIGIGSNIDPEKHLRAAATLLQHAWPEICFSPVYKTAPQEKEDQPVFLNAAGRIETPLPLSSVQEVLQRIETSLKKDPPYRFGPRTIDLDILFASHTVLESPELTVPHPKLALRHFALAPLCDLVERTVLHPILKKSFGELLQKTRSQECTKTDIRL